MNQESWLDVIRQDGHFILSSGESSNIYYDTYQLLRNPALLIEAAQSIHLPPNIDVLAAVALGAVPLGVTLSIMHSLPLAIVRTPKDHGIGDAVVGADVDGRRVLIVENVVTTGESANRAAMEIRRAGGTVIGMVSLIWRQSADFDGRSVPVKSGNMRRGFSLLRRCVRTGGDSAVESTSMGAAGAANGT